MQRKHSYWVSILPFLLLPLVLFSQQARRDAVPGSAVPTALRGDFASVSWSDANCYSWVHLRANPNFPKGRAYLSYGIADRATREWICRGSGWIPKRCLTWTREDTLTLRIAPADLPRRAGGTASLQGGIEVRWKRRSLDWDPTGEASPASAEGRVKGRRIGAGATAYLERQPPE